MASLRDRGDTMPSGSARMKCGKSHPKHPSNGAVQGPAARANRERFVARRCAGYRNLGCCSFGEAMRFAIRAKQGPERVPGLRPWTTRSPTWQIRLLAAAAEGLLPSTNEPHVLAYLQKHPSYRSKEIDFNASINWLKHPVAPDTAVIFECEAALIIARTMSKFAAVYKDGPSEWAKFLQSGVVRGHWPAIQNE